MERQTILHELGNNKNSWDFVVVGGGATGLGIALDAASRGFKTLLFEQSDFAKCTSSRSTKLVHGGVRYMAQGDIALVREACKERGILLANAPHITQNMSFVIPNYTLWDNFMYTVGLKFYDFLAGSLSLGSSKYINKKKVKELLPTVRTEGLKGGVLYHDGQFDDSRLAVNLAQTAEEQGAYLLNYAKVIALKKDNAGIINGVQVLDTETNVKYDISCKSVINATGVFVDDLLLMDNPSSRKMVRPSQGIHLMLDPSFLPSKGALMIPKTDDGRVLFAVPWHGKLVVGTTDTLREHIELEPHALEQEINFILDTAGRYLEKKPSRADVLSVFVGLRPLAAPQGEGKSTKEISRNHKILVSPAGLVTITGGKWTTYRRMAKDTIDRAITVAQLEKKVCITEKIKIHGYILNDKRDSHLYVYGSDRSEIEAMIKESPELGEKLDSRYGYTKAEVVWAVNHEWARTVDDILARRCRLLFIDARAAINAAPKVAELMAKLMQKDKSWIDSQVSEFKSLAKAYVLD